MSKKTGTYITWAVIIAVFIGGFILVISGGDQSNGNRQVNSHGVSSEPQVSIESQVKTNQDVPSDIEISGTSDSAEGPYLTTGEGAEDSNFFIPGDVGSIDSVRDKTKPTVVWVSASWCEICKAMRPFVWKSANKFADRVALVEIDLPDNVNVLTPLGVFGTPTFMVFDTEGNEFFRFSGGNQSVFEQQLARAAALN